MSILNFKFSFHVYFDIDILRAMASTPSSSTPGDFTLHSAPIEFRRGPVKLSVYLPGGSDGGPAVPVGAGSVIFHEPRGGGHGEDVGAHNDGGPGDYHPAGATGAKDHFAEDRGRNRSDR